MAVQTSCLLWLGAGQAKSTQVEPSHFESIVLVEARKDACEALKQQFKSAQNVEVVNAAIDTTNRELNFNRRSLSAFSSISEATGIMDLFPSLHTTKVDVLHTTSIDELIVNRYVDAVNITVVVDIPDLNVQLLGAILDNQQLKGISELFVTMPKFALFNAAATHSEINHVLIDHGFEVLTQDTSDPDIPLVHFKRSHLWPILNELNHKLNELENDKFTSGQVIETLNEQLAEITKQRDEQAHWHQENKKWAESLKSENETLKADSAQKQSQIDQLSTQLNALQLTLNELADNQQEKDAQLTKLTTQRDEQKHWHQENKKWAEALKVENEKIKAGSAELSTKNEQLLAQVSELQTKHNELAEGHKHKNAQTAELTKQLAETSKQRDEQAHWHQENKKWAEGLKQQLEIKEQEYSQLYEKVIDKEKSQTITQKLHLKASMDLSDLREKYKIKSQNESQLVELVKELYEKLHEASHFYSRLMLPDAGLGKGLDIDITQNPLTNAKEIDVVEDNNVSFSAVTKSPKRKTRSKNKEKRGI